MHGNYGNFAQAYISGLHEILWVTPYSYGNYGNVEQ
jgi:hypothetical protein